MAKPDDRLDSWKAIADYLGRDRRTLMRWERTAGLPIHRVAGGRGTSVFAYKDEIDQWLLGRAPEVTEPVPEIPRRWPRTAVITAIVTIALVSAAAVTARISRPSPIIAAARLQDRELVAFDASGRVIWRRALPSHGRMLGTNPALVTVADVDGDGRPDVVASVQVDADDGNEGDGVVFLVDHAGRMRWQRKLDGTYRFGEVEYGPGWFAEDVIVYRTAAGTRISVAQHHHTWWPSIVSTYDADGRTVATYVNAGWVRRLKVTPDGRYVLAAGLTNAFGGPMLAVLDAAHPAGMSPAGGTLPVCNNCPEGSPARYFVTPWTDLARGAETASVIVNVAKDGTIEWRASQRVGGDGKSPETIVTLSPQLEVLQRNVDDYYVGLHNELERAGQLVRVDPDWRHPRVREWTPAQGWREIR